MSIIFDIKTKQNQMKMDEIEKQNSKKCRRNKDPIKKK
jgi:hypothetical protein